MINPRPLLILLGLLLLWQGLVWITGVPAFLLPPPTAVAGRLVSAAPLLLEHAQVTLLEILLGLAGGVLIGGASALLMALLPPVQPWLLPILVLGQTIPVFALAPLLVLWFGYGLASKVVMAILIIYFPSPPLSSTGCAAPIPLARSRPDHGCRPDAAFAHQHLHALLELLLPLFETRALVVGADRGREIGIQIVAAHQRRMPVHVPAGEPDQLVEHRLVSCEHAREIHHLGEPEHCRMGAQREQVGRIEPGPGGLETRRRHARAELHLQRHAQGEGGVQEVAHAFLAEHVRDLVRIADRRGGAARQHGALELERRDQTALDVHVRVDKSGHGDDAAAVDLARAAVLVVSADDPVAADRDVALVQLAGRHVQEPDAFDHQIGGAAPERLIDPATELRLGQIHRRSPSGARISVTARAQRDHARGALPHDRPPRKLTRARGEPASG